MKLGVTKGLVRVINHFEAKNENKSGKFWNFHKKFLSLQRQNVYFDYPGKFPERASRIRHYPIYKAVHQCAALTLSKPLPLVITQTRLVLLSLTRGFDFI